MNVQDYVSAGYFLSRVRGTRDSIGIELRRESLANDQSPRDFFPDTWALSWCQTSRAERVEKAAVFGIPETELDRVISWADGSFDTAFGSWSVFFGLEEARAAARSMLSRAADLDLWGVGLHRSLLPAYCDASQPPPQEPGFSPVGASGAHEAACRRSLPLAPGGVVLGHEILTPDPGSVFNSPESLHLDEHETLRTLGIVPNGLGLIDSFSEALAGARHFESILIGTPPQIFGWLPWLIVRYPL